MKKRNFMLPCLKDRDNIKKAIEKYCLTKIVGAKKGVNKEKIASTLKISTSVKAVLFLKK